MSAKFSIKALDHMVLYVASIEASVAFYTTHLGMAHTSFAPAGKAGEVRSFLFYTNTAHRGRLVCGSFFPWMRGGSWLQLCFHLSLLPAALWQLEFRLVRIISLHRICLPSLDAPPHHSRANHLSIPVPLLKSSISHPTPLTPLATRHALTFGQQKINLHAASSPYAPHARAPLSSTADFCLLTDTPVQEVAAALREGGVELLRFGRDGEGREAQLAEGGAGEGKDGEGAQVVMERTGARGRLRSVYVRDPDGNLVEISNYV
ncbi:hypothetical protein HDK64DRAFT_256535 [Phyllosticta capitalensis]|uniref:Glyoxalase/fosfomycin resistance/dioxygenase domain-containing protein n=1 Tax=Phyllosticta capitalensis TaxID=121624 RepID=A0ABR1YF14_9PEZI